MGENSKLLNAGHLADVDVISNITSVFEYVMRTATDTDIVSAINWYPLANSFCATWAESFDLSIAQMAGVTAALSPQLRWDKNKAQAIEVVARLQNNKPLNGLMAYPVNLAKAQRIFSGENPLDVLGGMKVRSFYRNIMLDEAAVTVDRHAASIALYGLDTAKSGKVAVTDKLYKLLAKAYTDVASVYNVAPYVVQSVTWTYKAANGGKVE